MQTPADIVMMGRYQLGVALTDPQVRDIQAWLRTLTGEIPVTYVAEPQLPAKGAFWRTVSIPQDPRVSAPVASRTFCEGR